MSNDDHIPIRKRKKSGSGWKGNRIKDMSLYKTPEELQEAVDTVTLMSNETLVGSLRRTWGRYEFLKFRAAPKDEINDAYERHMLVYSELMRRLGETR